MTANELADLLDFDAKTLNWKAFADAATMLRQQQAEIEVLKSDTIPYKDLHQVVKNVLAGGTPDSELAEHKQIIREQQAEIYALKMEIHSLTYGERLTEYLRKARNNG